MTPEMARKLVKTQLDVSQQEHFDRLANNANQGTLTAEERYEYDEFVSASSLL